MPLSVIGLVTNYLGLIETVKTNEKIISQNGWKQIN